MTFRVLGKRLLVKVKRQDDFEQYKSSKLFVRQDRINTPTQRGVHAEVVSVGEDVDQEFQVGEWILIERYAGQQYDYNGQEHRFILEDEAVCVFD